MYQRPDAFPPILAALLALMLTVLAGCSSAVIDQVTTTAPRGPVGSIPGHVYLLRGLVGEVFSTGFYDLAARIKERGVDASVHSMYAPGNLAAEIIAKHRRAPAPVVLIGHSSGADAAIAIARRLHAVNIPVALMFGFDPTPIAGRIPDNVEVFINLYQKTNLIGGGEAVGASNFRGRIVNVDLRERREIIHITLDKSPVLHALVADKIAAILRPRAAPTAPIRGRATKGPVPVMYVTPLAMRYVCRRVFRSCCGTVRCARRSGRTNRWKALRRAWVRLPGRLRASTLSALQIRRHRDRGCWCHEAPLMPGLDRVLHWRLQRPA
jgi:fermentation-respiration switch protein FrsA (DUF1100 family)